MEKAKQILKSVPSYFTQYTDHSIDHKDQVIKNYEIFLTSEILNTLNKYELFFLVSATYLHDIGMSWLAELADIDNTNSREATEKYLREHHHVRAENYIRSKYELLSIEDKHQARLIGRICRGHRKEDLFNTEDFSREDGYDRNPINVAFLSLCLRLADELDITQSRTPKILYDNIGLTNDYSITEWCKHLSISSVQRSIEEFNKIKCHGETDSLMYTGL